MKNFQYDGGAALAQLNNPPSTNPPGDIWFAYGFVSHGQGCADPIIPGVYTRVANYAQWISDNTNSAVNCTNPGPIVGGAGGDG